MRSHRYDDVFNTVFRKTEFMHKEEIDGRRWHALIAVLVLTCTALALGFIATIHS